MKLDFAVFNYDNGFIFYLFFFYIDYQNEMKNRNFV
jgi:hypothetical protein